MFGTGLVTAALLMAACGGSNDKASTPASTGSASSGGAKVDLAAAQAIADKYTKAPTEITQKAPLGKPIPAGTKIIFANNALPGTILQGQGAKDVSAAVGITYEQINYESANAATLQAAFRTALAKKPNAILEAGNPPSTFGQSLIDEFKTAKIPIVVGSVCPLTVVDPIVQGAAGCDVEQAAGAVFANWFIADSKGTGKALFVNIKAIPSLVAFVDAFSKEVAAKCTTCKVEVLEGTQTQVAANELVPAAVNKLRTDSSFNYLFFDNAQFAKGVVAAVKAAGLDGKVKIGGRSADEAAIGALRDGTESAWTALSYPVVGMGHIDAALRAIMGLPAAPVVPPFQLLTQANAKDIKTPYNYPTDAIAQYKKLWGVN